MADLFETYVRPALAIGNRKVTIDAVTVALLHQLSTEAVVREISEAAEKEGLTVVSYGVGMLNVETES